MGESGVVWREEELKCFSTRLAQSFWLNTSHFSPEKATLWLNVKAVFQAWQLGITNPRHHSNSVTPVHRHHPNKTFISKTLLCCLRRQGRVLNSALLKYKRGEKRVWMLEENATCVESVVRKHGGMFTRGCSDLFVHFLPRRSSTAYCRMDYSSGQFSELQEFGTHPRQHFILVTFILCTSPLHLKALERKAILRHADSTIRL